MYVFFLKSCVFENYQTRLGDLMHNYMYLTLNTAKNAESLYIVFIRIIWKIVRMVVPTTMICG